jgi:hypothetical protein
VWHNREESQIILDRGTIIAIKRPFAFPLAAVLATFAVTLSPIAALHAQESNAPADIERETLRERVESIRTGAVDRILGTKLAAGNVIASFYERRDSRPRVDRSGEVGAARQRDSGDRRGRAQSRGLPAWPARKDARANRFHRCGSS